MNREAILYRSNYNGVVFTTTIEDCNGKIVTGRITIVTRNSCEMCCDTFNNKDSLAKICENYKPEHNAQTTLQKKLSTKIQKTEKGTFERYPTQISQKFR